MDELIIIWAVIIAAALLMEFITYEFYTAWFAAGGMAALIMAACEVALEWQIIVFVLLSMALLLSLRPLVKKLLQTETTPTNLDANIGKSVKLLQNVDDGASTVKIHDITWGVRCKEVLAAGTSVVITGMDGNKYTVEKREDNK